MKLYTPYLLAAALLSLASASATASDYGIDATVTEGISGCGGATEGDILVTNTNEGVWIRVGWWGESSGDNLLFRNPPSHANLVDCDVFDCETACPAPDPDDNCQTVDGGCDFIGCCAECACEIADEAGVEIAEKGAPQQNPDFARRICSLPRCTGHDPSVAPTCDNSPASCPPGGTPFCVTLQDKPESPNFQLEEVSFDGTCYIPVNQPLNAVVVSECS